MGSMHTRKILGAVEWTVGGYTDVNGDSRGSSERRGDMEKKPPPSQRIHDEANRMLVQ